MENMTNDEKKDFGTSAINRNGMTFVVGPTRAPVVTEVEESVDAEADEEAKAREEKANRLWAGADVKFPVGTKLRGKVVSCKQYGVFVETTEGFFGLVHGSQVEGWEWGRRFDEAFTRGMEIEVTVTKVDVAAHRMAFACALPAGFVARPKPKVVRRLTPEERVQEWAEENIDLAQAAHDWLAEELASGPIYGPLSNALSDRFGVPVPVSLWIRRYPEFACFSGKGDNPTGLPAVALAVHAPDPAYWKGFKTKTSDLASARTREALDAAKYGRLAARLAELTAFPDATWIAEYMQTAQTLGARRETFGAADAIERLVVPLMGKLGWSVGASALSPLGLVRGERGAFDLLFYTGEAKAERLAVAVICESVGTAFRSQKNVGVDVQSLAGRNIIERVLTVANCRRDLQEGFTSVVWTDGVEWVVFTNEALARRIGVISDRSGERILAETEGSDANAWFDRIVLPTQGSALEWLSGFAELAQRFGRENF